MGDNHGCVGECAGFAGAEQEAGQQQRVETRHSAGQGGEGGPPENDLREHAACTDSVAEQSRRNFKKTVGDGEEAGHPTPADGIDMQVLLDARPGDGNANAIEVGDPEQQDQETHDGLSR